MTDSSLPFKNSKKNVYGLPVFHVLLPRRSSEETWTQPVQHEDSTTTECINRHANDLSAELGKT